MKMPINERSFSELGNLLRKNQTNESAEISNAKSNLNDLYRSEGVRRADFEDFESK